MIYEHLTIYYQNMNKHCEIGSEPFAAGSLQELLGKVVGAAGARFVAPGRAVALPGARVHEGRLDERPAAKLRGEGRG